MDNLLRVDPAYLVPRLRNRHRLQFGYRRHPEVFLGSRTIAMVSGIGCTGRMAGYIRLDSYHTTHGRALPFATGLKLAKPDTKILVASGDGDLFAIGGNHFIHAARRNVDMTVICVNNLNYGMTGGQQAPSTPFGAKTTTSVNGSPEEPFNFCALAAACGAVYVARWTALHIRLLTNAIAEAMQKKGFTFIEVLTPCPLLSCGETGWGRRSTRSNFIMTDRLSAMTSTRRTRSWISKMTRGREIR